MEVSIYELLAAARESAKSDYIKGDSILCEKRFHPDTHYMVEIELLKNDNKLGKKGNYIRKFLTEPEYLPILQKQEKHLIKIKRQAIVQKGNLRDSGIKKPDFPQVLGRWNIEKCSRMALLQRSVAAVTTFLTLR